MNRRRFLGSAAATSTALCNVTASPAQAPKPSPPAKALMKAGHQGHSSDADLRVLAALGVNHICSALPSRRLDSSWSVEGLTRLRERVERFGIALAMVPLPLSSAYISRAENPHIMIPAPSRRT